MKSVLKWHALAAGTLLFMVGQSVAQAQDRSDTASPEEAEAGSESTAAATSTSSVAAPPAAPEVSTSAPGEGSDSEPAMAADDDTLDADTAALLAQLEADTAPIGATPSLQLYGFADVSFFKTWLPSDSALGVLVGRRSSFALGNLNLYLSSDLGEGWESLAEVRFTYLPNGSRRVNPETGVVERQDAIVSDYTNVSRERRVGGIFIERAWLQYSASPMFSVRAGSWLTPYGIWNVDHGSPTIIPVVRPYTIGLELLPESQTGVLVRGVGYPSDSISLGYAVGLSNGRGPVKEYADLDGNKAVTLRVHATHRAEGTLALGLSGYYGRFTDLQQSVRLTADGVELTEDIISQYDEITYAGDVKYTLGGFHLQGEFVLNERKYTEVGRTLHSDTTFTPDIRQYGGYGVVGYRFDWLGVMPYMTGEYFVVPNILEPTRPPTKDRISVFGIGINARPTQNVTIKLEGNYATFGGDIPEDSAFADPVRNLQTQAAWAF